MASAGLPKTFYCMLIALLSPCIFGALAGIFVWVVKASHAPDWVVYIALALTVLCMSLAFAFAYAAFYGQLVLLVMGLRLFRRDAALAKSRMAQLIFGLSVLQVLVLLALKVHFQMGWSPQSPVKPIAQASPHVFAIKNEVHCQDGRA